MNLSTKLTIKYNKKHNKSGEPDGKKPRCVPLKSLQARMFCNRGHPILSLSSIKFTFFINVLNQ